MNKRFLIGANFKMNKTVKELGEYMEGLGCWEFLKGVVGVDIVIFPSLVGLGGFGVWKGLEGLPVYWGGQNMYFEDSGAYTGEVSGWMLRDMGCEYVLIGHSERRHHFREEEGWVGLKLRKALDIGLKVILCVGELKEDRDYGRSYEVVGRQLELALEGVDIGSVRGVRIAYEPVWAIGGGVSAGMKDISGMHGWIRGKMEELYSGGVARDLVIQYGGSVNMGNVGILMDQEGVDGVLVGGGCLDLEHFKGLIEKVSGKLGQGMG